MKERIQAATRTRSTTEELANQQQECNTMAIASQEIPTTTQAPIKPSANLDMLCKQLAQERKTKADLDAILDARRTDFEKQNKELLDCVASHGEAIKTLDSMVRGVAVAEYKAACTANPEASKSLTDYVSIVVTKKPEYNVITAIGWAKEHKMCLIPETLDTKAFESLCKSDATRPDFVEIEETPTVRIASDLSKLLTAGQEG
jgi:hypothetical protein